MRCDPSTTGCVALLLVALIIGTANAQFSFTALGPFDPGSSGTPTGLVQGDFDADGNLDVLVTIGTNVALLVGDGTGNLALASTTSTGISYARVGAGDLNSDGYLDFAVSDYSSDTVDLYIGDGAGSFTLASSVAADTPGAVAIRDVNGDGLADVLIGVSLGFSGGNVEVHLGDGGATYPLAGSYAVGAFPQQFFFDDFDLDGLEDVLVVCSGAVPGPPGGLFTLLADGTGDFTVNGAADGYYSNASVGDLNGDAIPDVVVGENNDVVCLFFSQIRLGNGDGTFGPSIGGEFGLCGPPYPAIADFDGDGNQDYVRSGGTLFGGADEVAVFPGLGSGAFGMPQMIATAPTPTTVIAADFDGSGTSDFALAVDGGVAVYRNDSASQPEVFVRGDVGGDGAVQINDPIALLGSLFIPGSPPLICEDAADADDDGQVLIGDAVFLLAYLFVPSSPPPDAPFPMCGEDPAADTLADCAYPAMNCP